jgi:hypothetical protein
VQQCDRTGACQQNLLQMTPVNVRVHQQCRPLLPARSTAGWYSRRPMARSMQPLGRLSRHNEQHAALVIRYAFCEMFTCPFFTCNVAEACSHVAPYCRAAAHPGCCRDRGRHIVLRSAWCQQLSSGRSRLVAPGRCSLIIASAADASRQPQRQQQPAQQEPQTALVPQPRWLCKVRCALTWGFSGSVLQVGLLDCPDGCADGIPVWYRLDTFALLWVHRWSSTRVGGRTCRRRCRIATSCHPKHCLT